MAPGVFPAAHPVSCNARSLPLPRRIDGSIANPQRGLYTEKNTVPSASASFHTAIHTAMSTPPSGARNRGEAFPPDRATGIYQQLRELIVLGRLAPGARIIESEVATRLGASRTPVRSALQRLQQEGYLLGASSGKQLRLSVAPLTREDAREVFGLIGAIEGLGACWAAGLEPERRRGLAAGLRDLNAHLVAAVRREPADAGAVFTLHSRFHSDYLASLDAPRLLALHRAIKPQTERYHRLYSALVGEQASAEEHGVIIECIEMGDTEGAQRAVQRNWRMGAERLVRAIDLMGERGSW
jgi:DNA-binding GntR family transcriptional regulator